MSRLLFVLMGAIALTLVVFHANLSSAADPAVTCESQKLKEAAKYGSCKLGAVSKAVKKATTPDFGKCDTKFADKWPSIEAKGAGACPSNGDQAAIEARIGTHADDIAVLLAGGSVPPCSNQRFPRSGQTGSWGAGDDGDLQPGAALQYVDNGDGTITDVNTGLMWEKKILGTNDFLECTDETGSCANPHHADNTYSWSSGPCCAGQSYDGTIVTIFLEQLNNRCDQDTTVPCAVDADCAVPGGLCGFVGHRDWRLPGKRELESIVSAGAFNPAVDAAFHGASCGPACTDIDDAACGCTNYSLYWSSTTSLINAQTTNAWYVFLGTGQVSIGPKSGGSGYVRAVRGG